MEQEILHKVQGIELEIAKEVKRICDENGIKYFLDGGSLLGAVRHKGFIPWDDDLDIGMFREDYERFLEIAPKEMNKQYFLQTPYSDNNYGLFFSKVRKLGTIYIEKSSEKSKAHNEIWVDIFPYDDYPNDEKTRTKVIKQITFYRRILYVKSGIKPWVIKNRIVSKVSCFIGYLPYRIISLFISRKSILYRAKKIQTKFNGLKMEYKFSQGSTPCGKWIIPSIAFSSLDKVDFEDTKFTIPVGFDLFLKAGYGDYMQLPPENQRENRHNIIEVKI